MRTFLILILCLFIQGCDDNSSQPQHEIQEKTKIIQEESDYLKQIKQVFKVIGEWEKNENFMVFLDEHEFFTSIEQINREIYQNPALAIENIKSYTFFATVLDMTLIDKQNMWVLLSGRTSQFNAIWSPLGKSNLRRGRLRKIFCGTLQVINGIFFGKYCMDYSEHLNDRRTSLSYDLERINDKLLSVKDTKDLVKFLTENQSSLTMGDENFISYLWFSIFINNFLDKNSDCYQKYSEACKIDLEKGLISFDKSINKEK